MEQLREEYGADLEVRDVHVQLDMDERLAPQIVSCADSAGLAAREWQTMPIIIVLPGMAIAAAAMVAELHGRMGYFPCVVKLLSGPDRVFVVGEVLDLADVRSKARQTR